MKALKIEIGENLVMPFSEKLLKRTNTSYKPILSEKFKYSAQNLIIVISQYP